MYTITWSVIKCKRYFRKEKKRIKQESSVKQKKQNPNACQARSHTCAIRLHSYVCMYLYMNRRGSNLCKLAELEKESYHNIVPVSIVGVSNACLCTVFSLSHTLTQWERPLTKYKANQTKLKPTEAINNYVCKAWSCIIVYHQTVYIKLEYTKMQTKIK